MNSKTTALSITLVAAGVVIGFVAATYGAAAAMAEMTRDRDEVRDKLTGSMQTVTDLAAKDIRAARDERDALQVELDRTQRKAVKGAS